MESSKPGDAPVPFVRQLLQNNMLMLTVFLAVSAGAYFCIGLFFLLGR